MIKEREELGIVDHGERERMSTLDEEKGEGVFEEKGKGEHGREKKDEGHLRRSATLKHEEAFLLLLFTPFILCKFFHKDFPKVAMRKIIS